MWVLRGLFGRFVVALALVLGPQATAKADLRETELSGEWYVLIHYKVAGAADESITKFKDFAWSFKQSEKRLLVEQFPYVLFSEGTEEVRRHAMMEHLPWEPDAATWKKLRESVDVSSRAMTSKRLEGSVAEGFRSEPQLATGGTNTLTFSRSWEISFAPEKIRIVIVDSLTGGLGLDRLDEATVYELDESPNGDELRGRWREGRKSGTVRMVRARARRVLK